MASLEEQPISTITAISTFDPATTNTSTDITSTTSNNSSGTAVANSLVGNSLVSALEPDFGISACAEKQLLTPIVNNLSAGGNNTGASNINTNATSTGVAVDSIVEKLVSSLTLDMDNEPIGSGNTTLSREFNGNGVVASDHKSVSSRSSSLAGTMFSEVFENKGSDLESGSLEDSCGSLGADGMDKNCKICSSRLVSPRVLSCLHVFCESCLLKLLTDESNGNSSSASSTTSTAGELMPPLKSVIECPTCKQVTMIGSKGIESLTCDYILTNILDLSTIESEQLSCTSCKSKEKAISRCSECANFLCSGCDNAHKYMRCFENHEVVKLEDLQKATADKPLTIHKPLFCNVHTAENLKYYCFNCQIPVCNDCLIADHKGSEHHYDLIAMAEKSVRVDVENLMKEAKSKVQYCDAAASNLSSALTELQSQHDSARARIEETYQNYKKILEKCRDQSLTELGKLHSERELKIMDLLQNIENTSGKIDSTCKFTMRVLEQANGAEFLSMKMLISTQFINLISSTPKCDINYSLTFDTKTEKFEQVAQETFGKFRTESTPPSPKESTPPPTLPGMPPTMMSSRNGGMNTCGSQGQLAGGSSVTASSPISLPTSMQSSFDGDFSVLGNGFLMPNVMAPDSPPHQPPTLHHQISQQQQLPLPPPSQPPVHGVNGVRGFEGGVNNCVNAVGMSGSGIANGLNALTGGHGPIHGHNQGQGHGHGHGHNAGGSNPLSGPGNNLNVGLNSNTLGNGINASLNQGLNGLNGGTSGMNGGLNGNLNAGLNGPANSVGVGGGAPPPSAYNSILEYNLSRLASLTEATPDVALNDALVGPGAGAGGHHQAVVPASSSQNQQISLADILSGDQRAFNNLQALAKMGLNNNDFHTDMNQLLSSGASPGIDCILPDFCLPAATSPSLSTLGPLGAGPVDEMSIANFHAGAAPGTTNIVTGRNKATPMQIRCKFGSLGTTKGQFNSPHGFCLGVDEEIIVADTNNHRIEVFDKTGTLKFQFGVPGKEEGQLWYPRKVAVMHTNGKFVVCDRGNERSRMQIFSKCGHFMRKIAIRYIDIVAGLAVTSKGHIVAVDSVSPTVFVISEDGELVRWFDCSDYMREPSDIAIRDNDFYVCDFKGHCVAVFQEDGTFQYRIGNEKVTCFPNGIDISNAGDILIGDSHGNRFHVACYSRDGILQSEFECPHVKVSRCCGLKITSEGYVVTLAKNNHHVLVLNTLYVH
ncbi:brain tumor protein isoform X1 [Anastrepha obliqua]|uniref:brain tumor protein isoform X1 n=1 Tax=Anastrepha obliqua TaxID=95512 RepID=UPI00240A63A5|nr:brain tumor protein isoform X1 [Anastrepha obliqua]XP_054731152.1 brain tumor protein isoform X1 [Anastrepha obliqua]XP_054731154.1 brain tumor protein isoform X1 [Anastrepha obliqua]XP_054731155.1 brain tumor protein isoform X1 [Anastrepha obliqua]XP_054731156.1 brain tumor protein isoform X1 [Anastrepha obliqua]